MSYALFESEAGMWINLSFCFTLQSVTNENDKVDNSHVEKQFDSIEEDPNTVCFFQMKTFVK